MLILTPRLTTLKFYFCYVYTYFLPKFHLIFNALKNNKWNSIPTHCTSNNFIVNKFLAFPQLIPVINLIKILPQFVSYLVKQTAY